MAASRDVLRQYGNLSSATIRFVLHELRTRLAGEFATAPSTALAPQSHPARGTSGDATDLIAPAAVSENGHLSGVAMAVGPGLVIEMARLNYVPQSDCPDCVRARLVILAAGRHSRLTQTAIDGPSTGTADTGSQHYVGIKCHYEQVELPKQVALYLIDGGYGGINPIENGRANFCMLVTYEAFQQQGKSPVGMLDAVCEQHPPLEDSLRPGRLIPETLKTVAAVNTSQPSAPWRGAPCVGDAAAMITPLCGDGMAMALRSAEFCAPLADSFLRQGISEAELATAYSQRWHSEFDRRLRIGRLLQSASKAVSGQCSVRCGKRCTVPRDPSRARNLRLNGDTQRMIRVSSGLTCTLGALALVVRHRIAD